MRMVMPEPTGNADRDKTLGPTNLPKADRITLDRSRFCRDRQKNQDVIPESPTQDILRFQLHDYPALEGR